MWLKYGLKAQKLQKQHALKGQKLLAQGIALGIIAISKAPCKGKMIIALKQYRLYHSNDTASLAWLQVSLFTWLAIPV